MSAAFEKVNFEDPKIYMLVAGYCRESEQLLSTSMIDTITNDIVYICLLYIQPLEQFIHATEPNSIKSSNANYKRAGKCDMIQPPVQNGDGLVNGYGEIWINCPKNKKLIYEWTFVYDVDTMSIGIDSYDSYSYESCFNQFYNGYKFYAWDCCQGGLSSYKCNNTISENKKYEYDATQIWDNGFRGVVKMIFNIKDKTIRYIKNNIDFGIAFKNIDTSLKYRMAVSILTDPHRISTVTLSDFNVRYS